MGWTLNQLLQKFAHELTNLQRNLRVNLSAGIFNS
jgi:hypothetical protein